jgi:hypothetical protein
VLVRVVTVQPRIRQDEDGNAAVVAAQSPHVVCVDARGRGHVLPARDDAARLAERDEILDVNERNVLQQRLERAQAPESARAGSVAGLLMGVGRVGRRRDLLLLPRRRGQRPELMPELLR